MSLFIRERRSAELVDHGELIVRTCVAATAALLVSCAAPGADLVPPDSGWRALTFVGEFNNAGWRPARDCRSFGPGPYVVLRETRKLARFVTVHRDWVMPKVGIDIRPGQTVLANLSSCTAGYHLADQ